MSLSGLSVRRGITFMMLFLLMAGAGLFALSRLGIDYFPKVDLGQISVVTVLPGAGPSEMESLVTEPIEDAVSGVEGVETIESYSRSGISILNVSLSASADIDRCESDVREAVDRVRSDLPDEASDPQVIALESSMKPIVMLAFGSDVLDGDQLRRVVEDELIPELGRVEGVASVDLHGGEVRQVNVEVDPARLALSGIPLQQVYGVLAAVHGDRPGGEVDQGGLELSISVGTGFDDLQQLRDLVIGVRGGRPVSLGEVASVVLGYREQVSVNRLDGAGTVMAIFRKTPDANTVNTCRRLLAAIEEVTALYSGQIESTLIYSQEGFITRSMNDLLLTGVQAVLLAAAVLTFFLGSVSNAGIVSLSMPLSFIASFAAMYSLGINLNVMSLAGLSISIGMIVDNSVVVLENIHRRRREGEERLQAAERGASQVGMAVTASTLTTVAVFVPMLFVPGITGQIFRDLSITIASALFISLFVSQSLIPLLASRSKRLTREHSATSITGRLQGFLDRLEVGYSRSVARLIGRSRLVLVPVALLFLLSVLMLGSIPKDYLPDPAEGTIDVDVRLAPGTSLEVTDSLMTEMERAVLDVFVPGDLEHVWLSAGRGEGLGLVFGSSSSSSGELSLYLAGERDRSLGVERYDQMIREVLSGFPGIRFSVSSAIPLGSGYPVRVVVYGEDLEGLMETGDLIRREMSRIPGTVDLESSLDDRVLHLEFRPYTDRLQLAGLTAAAVGMELTLGVLGLSAGSFSDSSGLYDVNLRYAAEGRSTPEDVAGLVAFGRPLDSWGSLEELLVPEEIGRRNRVRCVSVSCGVSGRALGDVSGDVEAMLDTLDLGGRQFEMLGDVKDRGEAFAAMGLAIAAAVILVYMVMASQFESLLEPFIIIVEVPLAMIGVVWTLVLTGTTMGLTALVGLLMLAGIVVNNGIVFIDFANQTRRTEGLSAREAIVIAARKRLRPVLMTAMTTILALMPLAIGATDSSVVWAPMARTVAGGLAMATLLTLFVLPCLYVKLDGWHRIRDRTGSRAD